MSELDELTQKQDEAWTKYLQLGHKINELLLKKEPHSVCNFPNDCNCICKFCKKHSEVKDADSPRTA